MAAARPARIEVERSHPLQEISQIRNENRQAEDISEAAMVAEEGNTNVSEQNQDRTLSPNAIMPVLQSDVLPSLLALEKQTRLQHDHQILASSSLKTMPNSIWRERVVVWMYSIADHLRESRSIVSVATSILDRYAAVLASTKGASAMDSLRYEVASMTALFLAVRVAGSGNLSVQQLLAMRRHSKIQTEDIVKVGSDMVKLLSWKRRLVTPAHFLAKFLEVIPDDEADAAAEHDNVGHSARYLIEMSICDTCLSRSKPSDVALAALMNVLRADAPSMLEDFVDQVMKITSVDALSDRISSIRRRLHRLYSLSYDIRRPNLPHVVLESEDVSSDDVTVPSFHSSAAVRTISDDDLCGKWGGEDEGRCPSKRPSDGPADEHAPRLKRVKTDLHLSALC